jgi:hypothetical protein
VESQHAIAQQRKGLKPTAELLTLSEQQLLDCDPNNRGGCNGGYSRLALQ